MGSTTFVIRNAILVSYLSFSALYSQTADGYQSFSDTPLQRGSVSFESEPSEADVVIDSVPYGATPVNDVDINPGDHIITIRKKGYITCEYILKTHPGANRSFLIKLARSDGTLEVTSRPAGADITLNDLRLGTTPLVCDTIKPGTYQLTLSKAAYLPYRTTVTVVRDQRALTTATLTSLAYLDSLHKANLRKFQWTRRVIFGLITGGCAAVGYMSDKDMHDAIVRQDEALAGYSRAGLTVSEYDSFWREAQDARRVAAILQKQRTGWYAATAAFAAAFCISIKF
jgi:hypothetical protein